MVSSYSMWYANTGGIPNDCLAALTASHIGSRQTQALSCAMQMHTF